MLPFYLDPPNPQLLLTTPWMAVDFETTNTDKGDPRNPENRIVKAAIMSEGHAKAQLVAPTDWERAIPRKFLLVAHNAKFELGWFLRHGILLTDVLVWDTMVAQYVINGNRREPLNLDFVARKYGFEGKEPIIDALMRGGICPSEMPEHLLERRVLSDVETTAAIFLEQRRYITENGLLPVMFTRSIVTPVLTHIERNGMTLDESRVQDLLTETQSRMAKVDEGLREVAGDVNLRSPKQVAELLYDKLGFTEPKDRRGNPIRTATGARATDKNTLAQLKATTPQQKLFVQFRSEYAKLAHTLSSSLLFFSEVCRMHGGTFVFDFNQTRTKTHRLSGSGRRILCSDGKARGVQSQNLDRTHKKLFKASEPGHSIVEVDGAGLEFRVAADLARDAVAKADILNPDHDVHTYTASILTRKAYEDISKTQRTAAKKHTFKPLFSTGTSGTKDEVRYYQEFKTRYAAICKMQDEWIGEVMRTGRLRIPSGLICYWNLKMTPSGYVEGANKVRNLPIQSFATADIIPVSLVYTFWRARFVLDAKIVNTVHDSVIAEVRDCDIDRYKELAIKAFLEDTTSYLRTVYGHEMFVPLGVGIVAGSHWGEGDEESYSQEDTE